MSRPAAISILDPPGTFETRLWKDLDPMSFVWEGRHQCHSERLGVSICSEFERFDAEGRFEVQILDGVLFPMLFDENDAIVVTLKYPLYQIVWTKWYVRTIWITGQFRSTTMKESRPRVISSAFQSEVYHSERPRVSIRSNVQLISYSSSNLESIVTPYSVSCPATAKSKNVIIKRLELVRISSLPWWGTTDRPVAHWLWRARLNPDRRRPCPCSRSHR